MTIEQYDSEWYFTLLNTSYVNHFFPAWISNMIQIHSGKTSRPRDFVARSVAARPYALKLASLTFKNLWEVDF